MFGITYTNQCDNPTNRLDVRFTSVCDNSCPFCVEKGGREPQQMLPPAELAAKTIAAKPEVVGILGGEPLLYPKQVLEYLSLIRPHVPKIYITTSLPFTIKTHMEIVQKILAQVDGFNVSLLASTPEKHNKILRAKNLHNRFLLLQSLTAYSPEKIRACINLYKGGIDSLGALYAMMHGIAPLGIRNVKINEIQWDDAGYISYEQITHQKLPPSYACGCYTTLPKDDPVANLYPDINIKLHRSCWKTTKAINPTIRDIIKDIGRILFSVKRKPFRVLYEDGLLSFGWLKKQQKKEKDNENISNMD